MAGIPKSYDPDLLVRLYVEEGLTAEKIGKRLNVHVNTVFMGLRSLGIERRPPGPQPNAKAKETRSQVAKERERRANLAVAKRLKEKERLKASKARKRQYEHKLEKTRTLYEDAKLSTSEIAKKLRISPDTVHLRLSKLGIVIPVRRRHSSPLDSKILRKLYVVRSLSIRTIAKQLDTSRRFVSRELSRTESRFGRMEADILNMPNWIILRRENRFGSSLPTCPNDIKLSIDLLV